MIHVGQKLHDERLRKGLSIDDVAKATKIKAAFLSAIEKEDYQKLPSAAYVAGFVRNYSSFLGLPQKESLALFRRGFDEKKTFRVLPIGLARETAFSTSKFRLQQSVILGILLFFGLLGYILFQYKYAFINPPLMLSFPKESQVLVSLDVEVLGKTDQSSTVSVNDISVSVDPNGDFKKTIHIFPGQATITVKAVNRFGRQTTLERHIEVKPQ